MDQFGLIPFAQAGSISKDPVDPVPASGTAFWLSDLSDGAIETLIKYSVPPEGMPRLTGNVYVNFLLGEEARHRAPGAYSQEAYSRLKEVKAKYDPHNCFSHHVM